MAQDRPNDTGGAIELAFVSVSVPTNVYGPPGVTLRYNRCSMTSAERAGTHASSYTGEVLTDGTAYYYIVTASDGSQESTASNEASATPVVN